MCIVVCTAVPCIMSECTKLLEIDQDLFTCMVSCKSCCSSASSTCCKVMCVTFVVTLVISLQVYQQTKRLMQCLLQVCATPVSASPEQSTCQVVLLLFVAYSMPHLSSGQQTSRSRCTCVFSAVVTVPCCVASHKSEPQYCVWVTPCVHPCCCAVLTSFCCTSAGVDLFCLCILTGGFEYHR